MQEISADIFLELDCELAEGPVWAPEAGRLCWVDIPAGRVHRAAADGTGHGWFEVGRDCGALALRRAGGLVLAARDRFELRGPDDELERAVPVPDIADGVRFNDGGCDPRGRFLAGTMAYGQLPGAGRLYALEPDGSVRTVWSGVTISNGLVWTADGTTLYYVDTPQQTVEAFDYDLAAGAMSNPRTVLRVDPADGGPDGLTMDADGCLWLALFRGGQVRRYAPSGELLATVRLPVPRVTSCAFGGPALDTLYITTAREGMDAGGVRRYPLSGSIFAVRPGVTGVPERVFEG